MAPLLPVQVPRDASALWAQSTMSILSQGSTKSLSKTCPRCLHPKTSPWWDLWGPSHAPVRVPAPPEEGSGSKAPVGEAGGAAAAQAGKIFPGLEKQLLITDKTPSGDFDLFSSPLPAGAFAEGKPHQPPSWDGSTRSPYVHRRPNFGPEPWKVNSRLHSPSAARGHQHSRGGWGQVTSARNPGL